MYECTHLKLMYLNLYMHMYINPPSPVLNARYPVQHLPMDTVLPPASCLKYSVPLHKLCVTIYMYIYMYIHLVDGMVCPSVGGEG